jgi:DNA-binding NarL/FixJ family response regulator
MNRPLSKLGEEGSRTRVLVLTAHSLFTEGVANRLGQESERIDLEVVDSRDADAIARVLEDAPSVVLFEAHDDTVERASPLVELLGSREVKVIRLDPGRDEVQVLTSERRSLEDPKDLIEMVL